MRTIDADALCEEFKRRQRAALRWKEKAILADDEEIKIRADAVLAFLSEVKLTIDNAPTVTPIDETFSTAVDKYGDNTFSVSVISSKGEKIDFKRVKKGEWIEITEYDGLIHSKCNQCQKFNEWCKTNYCPNCGAKMKNTNTESEEKNMKEKTGREFISIVAIYIPDEVCLYKEYKGKPYYSIRYKENGEEHIGYSTYSLDVLSDFLIRYFLGNGEEVVGNGLYNLDTSSESEEKNMKEMTVEQYRERMIEAFRNTGNDNLIALVCPPNEKDFKAMESLLRNFWNKEGEEE